MADDIRVVVDPAAVRELFRDWRGPVGEAVEAVTQEVEDIARGLAPVSPVGSYGKGRRPLAPPGFLKAGTRRSAEHHYDDQGHVMGLVGAPTYPFGFIANFRSHKGFTYNPRSARHPGRVTTRKADDNYLQRAIDAAPHIDIGTP